MTPEQIIVQTLSVTENELRTAMAKHGQFVDYHHGWGVLAEEVEELFKEICRKDEKQNPHKIKAEAVQVAAMACKIAILATERAKEMTK